MKRRIDLAARAVVAGVLASCIAGAGPANAEEDGDLLSVLSGAVLEWCEAKGGEFMLPTVASPGCMIVTDSGVSGWGGHLGIFPLTDASWWWEKRSGLSPGMTFGVLWWTPPRATSDMFCDASDGVTCPCDLAHAALDNPASVPVVLIGPGADSC